MHRIDGPGATGTNTFTSGNPATGVAATQVTPEWLTAIQEEIAGIILGNGASLVKADNTQLYAALKGARSIAANGYQKLQSGLIIQWGQAVVAASGTNVAATLPVAFPNACLASVTTRIGAGGPVAGDLAAISVTTTTATLTPAATSASARTYSYLVIGW